MNSNRRTYANYALGVLVLVYVFNFVDRQILSILAEEIQADLGLSDATIGYLYGTAFAVFYAIFGIPLARLADVWLRTRLIAIGLAAWSLMTALSGLAGNFATLAALRIGVGVGESSASPAAYSLLGDYFPPRLRATALALYSGGIYIGIGLGLFLGGWVVQVWTLTFPQGTAPFGLAAWQAAFFLVGLPGLLMAVWVWTLREPTRGAQEVFVHAVEGNEARPLAAGKTAESLGSASPDAAHILATELAAVLPPLTVFSLWRAGAGLGGVLVNLLIAVVCSGLAWQLIAAVGSPAQWISLAIGSYSFASWVQGLALRDRRTFEQIFRSRSMLTGMTGFGLIAFVAYGVGFWGPPFFLRIHAENIGRAGTILGLCAAVGGWLGVTLGGVLSDRLKRTHAAARPLTGILSALLALPAGWAFASADGVHAAYAWYFVFQIASAAWIGPAVALSSELVEPRLRATAGALYILMVTFIGLALGPYMIGLASDLLQRAGDDAAAGLRTSLLASLVAYLPAIVLLAVSARAIPRDPPHGSR
jgi:MFS family permease